LAQSLRIHYFFPGDDMESRTSWVERLEGEIRRAHVMIVLWTPGASRSAWMERETSFFSEQRRGPILPIVFGDSFDLNRIPLFLQQIQALREDEAALREGPSDHALDRILYAVRRLTAVQTETQRPSSVSQEKLPLNEGKLILVGRGEVGKTSLVRRLAENDFRGDESKTQGIKITNWA
jgi:TIR domain/Ras of Complex, Roc, domain of DAPkinase